MALAVGKPCCWRLEVIRAGIRAGSECGCSNSDSEVVPGTDVLREKRRMGAKRITAGEAALSVSGRRSPGVGSDELVVLRGKALKFESTELGLQARGLEGRRLGASNIFVVCRVLS
jgi:hypothetical protein